MAYKLPPRAVENRRTWREHAESTRAKIRVTQLVNRLNDFVDDKVAMTAAQVKAAQILLAKVLPDQTAIEHTAMPELTLQEKFMQLVNQVGESQARTIYPDLADKYLGQVKEVHESPEQIQ